MSVKYIGTPKSKVHEILIVKSLVIKCKKNLYWFFLRTILRGNKVELKSPLLTNAIFSHSNL